MTSFALHQDSHLEKVLDAIPAMIIIVDNNMKIIYANKSALYTLGKESDIILRRLCGDVMHCINVYTSKKDCGLSDFCQDCVLRRAITTTSESNVVFREKHKMLKQISDMQQEVVYLVSASPVEFSGGIFTLLTLEDITELTLLKTLTTACSGCSKVKNEHGQWENITHYLKRYEHLNFSHGLCEDCLETIYPEVADKVKERKNIR
jgi:transcriptional regulator with PAS, ATPase and Fis domain